MTVSGRSARMLRNTLSNSVGRAVTLATAFILTPYILHSLGEASFGVWVLANVLVGYGSLLDLGMGSAILKYVADARATDDTTAAAELLGTATRTYLGLAVLGLVVGGLVSTQAHRVIHLGTSPGSTLEAVLALVTVSFAINLAATPATATLRGLQRYDVTNAITVASSLLTAGLTLLVLYRGGGVVAMVALTVPVSLLTQATSVLVLRKLHPDFALRWSPTSRSAGRKMTRFGLTLTVGQVALLLQQRSSEVIIASVLSVTAVAPYSLARRLSDLPHVISDQFIKVLLPVASELHATGSRESLRRLYLVSTRVTVGMMLPMALCACFLSADLLELWVGAQYRGEARLVVVLVIASVAATSQWPAGSVFQGIGRFGPFAVGALVTGVATVALTLTLVRPYGLVGVVIGVLVPTVAEALFFVGPFTLRRLGVPASALAREVLLPVLLPMLPCVAVLLVARRLLDTASWPTLLLTGAVASAAYVGGYLLSPATDLERNMLVGLARRRHRT